MKKMLVLWLVLALSLSVCAYAEESEEPLFTQHDLDASYEESGAVYIAMDGDRITSSSGSVKTSGKTIFLTREATYVLSGTLDDGMIVVNAAKSAKVQLVLNGVSITNATGAPLYILEADKVFVTLADDTENALAGGGSFEPIDSSNIDAAVFSKQDLTFNGSGSLSVTSPAGHGIVSKDDLVFTGGVYRIDAASHGIDANDSVRVMNAELTITAGKDGIHAEHSDDAGLGFVFIESGTFDITAEGDGISAGAAMQIEGGTFDILAGGGHQNAESKSPDFGGGFGGRSRGGRSREGRPPEAEENADESSASMKGIKSKASLVISDGVFNIDSADDAVHSNGCVTINGGTFAVASGDDAFHAEETLAVTDGRIDISSSYEGLEALHIDVSGGDIRIISSDDGLNAAGGVDESGMTGGRDGRFGGRFPGGWGSGNSDGSIVISGGTLHISASGDGIDANGTLLISGGYTTIMGPTRGDTAVLDYDLSGEITGGTFIGTGSSMMAQSLSGSSQGVIGVGVGSQEAGAPISVKDAQGVQLLDHTPQLPYQILIYSSPQVVSGETYSLSMGTVSGEIDAQ